MTPARIVVAVGGGLVLATFPLLRYRHFGAPSGPHADHESRFGGQLGMTGDHLVELVRGKGKIEIYVSDAVRRPVHARSGSAIIDGGEKALLEWAGYRLLGEDKPGARVIDVEVVLDDGTRLATGFDVSMAGAVEGRAVRGR